MEKDKTVLKAIVISLIVSAVYAIVYFYKLTLDDPYSRWVSPAPLVFLCLSSVVLFFVLTIALVLIMWKKSKK